MRSQQGIRHGKSLNLTDLRGEAAVQVEARLVPPGHGPAGIARRMHDLVQAQIQLRHRALPARPVRAARETQARAAVVVELEGRHASEDGELAHAHLAHAALGRLELGAEHVAEQAHVFQSAQRLGVVAEA